MKSNQVVTIHDASTLDHPQWFNSTYAAWYRFSLPLLMRHSRGILTPSVFSKERLLKHARIREEKITVIPYGVGELFHPVDSETSHRVADGYGLPHEYILVLGSQEPRKNLRRLFLAWDKIRSMFPPLRLVVVGRGGRVFRSTGYQGDFEGVQFLGYVPDEDLPPLLSGARLFAYPSLYEGFGLPPLEAMACNCPVVVSSAASLPEVCGDAAFYFDPLNINQMAEALEAVLKDNSLAQCLRRKGLKRTELFTWGACARDTLAVLREAAQ
jgi:glycosyltransferase involved in cell wall biosynthesis